MYQLELKVFESKFVCQEVDLRPSTIFSPPPPHSSACLHFFQSALFTPAAKPSVPSPGLNSTYSTISFNTYPKCHLSYSSSTTSPSKILRTLCKPTNTPVTPKPTTNPKVVSPNVSPSKRPPLQSVHTKILLRYFFIKELATISLLFSLYQDSNPVHPLSLISWFGPESGEVFNSHH